MGERAIEAAIVATDAVVFTGFPYDLKILLIKRAHDPCKDKWALPGGHVEAGETLDQAAARELQEETGLAGVELRQFHTFGDPGRDPRGRCYSVAYVGYTENSEVKSGDDAAEAKWFSIRDLPELAFDHKDIVAMAMSMLRGSGGCGSGGCGSGGCGGGGCGGGE